MRLIGFVLLGALTFISPSKAKAWDSSPWLDDLAQLRGVIDRDYPNRDWLTGEREVSLDRWFDRAATAIKSGGSDADARAALDALIKRFNDGHIELRWPTAAQPGASKVAPPPAPPPTIDAFCAARGYDAGQVTPGTAAALPGYRALEEDGPFRAGLVRSGNDVVGIIRIGVFSPEGYPSVCVQAMRAANIAFDRPCDEMCEDRLLTEAYRQMTRGLMQTVERLRAAGARVLMVDLTRNGGGSEWAEAAARIVAPIPLRSAPIMVIRSGAWVARWRDLEGKLRAAARTATRQDRATLLDLAQQAAVVADGLKPCPATQCSRLARAGYASGLLPELTADRFDGKAWGPDVFSAAQFPYRDSVWKGPLIVLVDDETWSAAEQFTALLRDNDAAIVMGTRTGGAGCGHLYGNDPVTLTNSKAIVELPNCARLRRDGRNEVSGIVPDVATGVRWNDGPAFAGRLTAARLAEAIAQARTLAAKAVPTTTH